MRIFLQVIKLKGENKWLMEFRKMDINGDGSVSADEIRQVGSYPEQLLDYFTLIDNIGMISLIHHKN